jgi:hypothetical protein
MTTLDVVLSAFAGRHRALRAKSTFNWMANFHAGSYTEQLVEAVVVRASLSKTKRTEVHYLPSIG